MRVSGWLLYLFSILIWPHPAVATVQVFVSVAPLKYITQRVGEGHIRVQSMVQPGHSPVTYEPTARQMAALSSSQLYIRAGVPFERTWMSRVEKISPDLRIVDIRAGISLHRASTSVPRLGQVESEVHSHDEFDPHIWLDPSLVKIIATNIRDRLIEEDPGNTEAYERNTKTFLDALDRIDAEIRGLLADIENRKFLVFHPAWGYFARAYDLEQIAVEHEGKEPGPRALVELVGVIRREGIKTVFVQKQFSARVAQSLAAEIEGSVVTLDPLAEDYLRNLRQAAVTIANAGRSGNE